MASPTTPSPLFIDAAVARALEGAEAATSRAFCEAAASLYPGSPIRAIPCGGGFGLHYGPADPLNAVKGVGLDGPVDPNEWDALETAFRSVGSPVVVDLSPFADEGFVAILMDRGYKIGSFETVLCRSLDDASAMPSPALPAGLTIEEVGRDQSTNWTRVVGVGFANGGEPMKFAVDFALVRSRLKHSVMLLASVDGQPAGGASISIHQNVAHMAGAAVLPAFRGRGLQQGLTAARLRLVRERGCTLAKLDVQAGSGSYRNAVRSGFQVAYTRPQLVRTWSSTPT